MVVLVFVTHVPLRFPHPSCPPPCLFVPCGIRETLKVPAQMTLPALDPRARKALVMHRGFSTDLSTQVSCGAPMQLPLVNEERPLLLSWAVLCHAVYFWTDGEAETPLLLWQCFLLPFWWQLTEFDEAVFHHLGCMDGLACHHAVFFFFSLGWMMAGVGFKDEEKGAEHSSSSGIHVY